MSIFWTEERIKEAAEVHRQTRSLITTAKELSKRWKTEIKSNAIDNALRRAGVDRSLPSENKDVSLDNLSGDVLTERIADLILRTARDLKLEPQNLTWVDFKNHVEYAFGADETGLIAPRHITRVGGFNTIRDAFFPSTGVSDFDLERQELAERAKLNQSVSLLATRDALLLKQIEELWTRVYAKFPLPEVKYKPPKAKERKRELNAVLSDWHYAALMDSREVIQQYGSIEESRGVAYIAAEIADMKPQYRENTHLRLLGLGDWLENELHYARTGSPVAEAVCAVTYALVQVTRFLAAHFPTVEWKFTGGNHDRILSVHPQRATAQKWNSYAWIIAHSVKLACHNLKNVTFDIPRMDWVTWESFGQKGIASHGDTAFAATNPKSLADYINRMNASLKDTEEYKVFARGHWHTALVQHLDNGCTLIQNGGLPPSNGFALGLGIFENSIGQMVFEGAPGYIVGDCRFIRVLPSVYKDASLDKIIAPHNY